MITETAEQMLAKVHSQLLFHHPFYATILYQLQDGRRAVGDDVCPIVATDGDVLLYNPEGFSNLPFGQRKTAVAQVACFPPDTLIMTREGLKPIGEIQQGDYVYGKWGCFSRVEETCRRPYRGPVVAFQPSLSLPFKATPDHPILCVELPKKLRPGRSMPTRLDELSEGSIRRRMKYVAAKDIDPSRHLMVFKLPCYENARLVKLGRMRQRSAGQKKIFINEDIAYFLGWFVGDGTLHYPSAKTSTWFGPSKTKRNISICFALHDPIAAVAEIVEREFGRKVTTLAVKGKRAKRIRFSSTTLGRYLQRNFYAPDREKTIPLWMLSMPENILRRFVDGLLESDGYETADGHRSITSSSLHVAGMLPYILLRLGINPNLHRMKIRGPIRKQPYKIGWTESNVSTRRDAGVRVGNCWITRIVSATREEYEGDVCNLETTSHTYSLPFVTVHNCHIAHGDPAWMLGKDPDIANIAADHPINHILLASGFEPIPGWCCDDRFKDLTKDQIYQKLLAEKHQQPPGGGGGKQGQQNPPGGQQPGPGGGQKPGQPGGQNSQNQPQPQANKGKAGQQPGPGGGPQPAAKTPGGFGQIIPCKPKDAKRQDAERKLAVETAANAAKAAGKLPGHLARMVEEIRESKLDWREILRAFLTNQVPADFTWSRPSRRLLSQGIYLPSVKKEGIGKIMYWFDASGSFSRRQLEASCSEVNTIHADLKPLETTVGYFDTAVYNVESFGPGEEVAFHPKGGGGTDFRCMFRHVDALDQPPQCMVIFTDLEGVFPSLAPEYPVLWISVGKRHKVAPFGETLRLASEE